jgi:pimeloyl-ACP methyl ester carboxylesterase
MTVETVDAAMDFSWGPLFYSEGGAGPVVLLLHNELGFRRGGELLSALSESCTVITAALPGFPPSAVPQWMRTVSEMATVMNQFLQELRRGPCGIIGLGFGGWVAAEMAVQCRQHAAWLALQSPVGIRPAPGEEILDRFLFKEDRFVEMGFADGKRLSAYFADYPDDKLTQGWDAAREMITRVAFKPYLFNPALPYLLSRLAVPTLVVHGDTDHLVPHSCAEGYVTSMREASLVTVPGGGHWLDLEQPAKLADTILDFGAAHPAWLAGT